MTRLGRKATDCPLLRDARGAAFNVHMHALAAGHGKVRVLMKRGAQHDGPIDAHNGDSGSTAPHEGEQRQQHQAQAGCGDEPIPSGQTQHSLCIDKKRASPYYESS